MKFYLEQINANLFAKSSDFFRKKRAYLGLILILLFFFSCIFLRDWSEWTKLGEIGKFFGGLSLVLAAWQFSFQESNNRKEQISLARELNDEILKIESELSSFTLEKEIFQIEREKDLSYIQKSIIFLNKLDLLLEHKLVLFNEIYIFSGNSLSFILVISIKYCNNYEVLASSESKLTSEFIERNRYALISIFNRLIKVDNNLKVFTDEVKKLEDTNFQKGSLAPFINNIRNKNNDTARGCQEK